MKDARVRAAAEMQSALADFSRNGRWGTCGSCPCDGQGRKLPELCENTSDASHQLNIDSLAKQFNLSVAQFEGRSAPAVEGPKSAFGLALEEYRARWEVMRGALLLGEARAILVADRALGVGLAQLRCKDPSADIPDFDAVARDAWCLLASAAHDLIEASKVKP